MDLVDWFGLLLIESAVCCLLFVGLLFGLVCLLLYLLFGLGGGCCLLWVGA